jgi:hypothetical protein
MADFDLKAAVESATNEVLQSEDFNTIIKNSVKSAVEKAIQSSFNYGALSKAIDKKIEEYLVPYIENYDMSEFVPKLDDVLTEIVNKTPLYDVKRTLNNFKSLMTVPESNVVSMKDLFDAYCKYMAKVIDTTGRNITYDSGTPQYEEFECYANYKDISSDWSLFKKISFDFTTDDKIETELSEPKNFNITLTRYKDDDSKDFEITFDREININGLRSLSDFEIMLISLVRAGVKVRSDSIDDYTDYITPEKEPELTYE